MGPELPQDPGEEDLRATMPHHQHIVVTPSDDSDNETVNAYDGYEPLSTDEGADSHSTTRMDINDGEDFVNEPANGDDGDVDLLQAEVTHGDPNLPYIQSVDAEIESQVWNEPRPRELQIELDNVRTEEILNAMAGFTLPNVEVPTWAAGVPEERWKNELLERIRQRDKETDSGKALTEGDTSNNQQDRN